MGVIRRAILKAVIQIRRARLMLMMILMIKRVREKVKMGLSLNQHSLSSLLYSPWPPDCICKKSTQNELRFIPGLQSAGSGSEHFSQRQRTDEFWDIRI